MIFSAFMLSTKISVMIQILYVKYMSREKQHLVFHVSFMIVAFGLTCTMYVLRLWESLGGVFFSLGLPIC